VKAKKQQQSRETKVQTTLGVFGLSEVRAIIIILVSITSCYIRLKSVPAVKEH
jgi:hypothetical protein